MKPTTNVEDLEKTKLLLAMKYVTEHLYADASHYEDSDIISGKSIKSDAIKLLHEIEEILQ
jgi:hypothetical protein